MKRLLRSAALGLADALPERLTSAFVGALIGSRFRFHAVAGRTLIHGKEPLYLPRFDDAQLDQAVRLAERRFPRARRILLTDHPDDPGIQRYRGTIPIQAEPAPLPSGTSGAFICAYRSDDRLVRALRAIAAMPDCSYVMPKAHRPPARYFHRNDTAWAVLDEIARTCAADDLFDLADFENLIQAQEMIRGVEGDYVEVGVFKGLSAQVALTYMKRAGIARKVYLLDTYEGFTYEAARSSADAAWAGEGTETSMALVEKRLQAFDNKELIRTNIVDNPVPDRIARVALCNIDVDLYEAVLASLRKFAPLVVKGGIMIVEDQGHTPYMGGAYLALDEFLRSDAGRAFLPIQMGSGQAFLVRVG